MEFSRQEYWSGFPFPSPGDLPSPWVKPTSLASPKVASLVAEHGLQARRLQAHRLSVVAAPELLGSVAPRPVGSLGIGD